DELIRIVEVQAIGILKFLPGHADQPDVAEVQNITALDAGCAVELPAADQAGEQTTGFAKQRFASANRQFINPVELEGMSHDAVIARAKSIDPWRAARERRRAGAFGEDI